jgi:hypothetical protein
LAALKGQGLTWGGDWVSIKDYDHFQMSNLPVSPNAAMEADYCVGDQACLQTVWMNCGDGKYSV